MKLNPFKCFLLDFLLENRLSPLPNWSFFFSLTHNGNSFFFFLILMYTLSVQLV